jgi:hypothetical protein
MLPARTFSISIAMPWRALYERIWRPEVFPTWAAGLAETELRAAGDLWEAMGPDGPIRIRFTPQNDFGVMDHVVDTGEGAVVEVPLRVVANGDGAEVLLTLFRQPGMRDERFAADIKLVNRDLRALKAMVERPSA